MIQTLYRALFGLSLAALLASQAALSDMQITRVKDSLTAELQRGGLRDQSNPERAAEARNTAVAAVLADFPPGLRRRG